MHLYNKKFFETIRLGYQLKHYDEIEELKSIKKCKLKLTNFIDIALNNFNVDDSFLNFIKTDDSIKNIYFFIIMNYMSEIEENESNITLKKFIDDSYAEDNWGLIHKNKKNEKENIDTYRRRVYSIINSIIPYGSPQLQNYLITQVIIGDRYKGHKISKSYEEYLDRYLKAYNDKTFCAVRDHIYSIIPFHEYSALVNSFKKNIFNSSENYKNMPLYELENLFNLELIKKIGKTISILGETSDQYIDEGYKKSLATKLFDVLELNDFALRDHLIESYISNLNNDNYINNWSNNIHLLSETINIFVSYVVYLLENVFTKSEIYSIMHEEIIYFHHKNPPCYTFEMNEYVSKDGNSYNIITDFEENDFKIVMESLQYLYNSFFPKDFKKFYRIEKEMAYKIANDINTGLTLTEICDKYQCYESYAVGFIAKYKIWKRSHKDFKLNTTYKEILNKYRQLLAKEHDDNKLQFKIISDLGAGFEISDIRKKYILNKNDISRLIPNYIKEFFILADYNSELQPEQIIEKYEINESQLKKYITKKIIWLKLKDDFRRHPNIKISEFARKYKIDRRTTKKYIESKFSP